MKIAVIGTGNVGGALGRRWAKGGHTVFFGTITPQSDKVQNLLHESGPTASAHSPQEAAVSAEIIALAVPWVAAQDAIRSLGNLQGKILLDCTNPLNEKGQLALEHTTSGGEQVALWADGAHVVKVFNTTGAGNMANSDYGTQKPSMFLCGDDAASKQVAAQLAEELGFEAIDSGPLSVSRYLESLTMLWVQLAYTQGLGPNVTFKVIRRP